MKTLVYGSSVKGNSHFISGTECQDSNSFLETDFSEDEIKVVALSDGHGGAPYFRSAQGSKFAVEIAKRELYAFVHKVKDVLDEIDYSQHIINTFLSQLTYTVGDKESQIKAFPELLRHKRRAQAFEQCIALELEAVKSAIVKAWCKAVDDAFAAEPIEIVEAEVLKFDSVDEKTIVESYIGYGEATENRIKFFNCGLKKKDIENIRKNPRQLYGATLIVLAQYKEHIFVLQVGDGDVMIIDSENRAENPMNAGKGLIANESHSLCELNVLKNFEAKYFRRNIKIAMLSTDGIVNSLENENGLAVIARGLYESIDEEPAEFRKEFKPLLRQFSNGSSDDCTICFIANGIKDKSYDIIKASKEQDEEHTLDSTRRPLFDTYSLNRDLYPLAEIGENKTALLSEVNFAKVGITAIHSSLLKEQYIELVESKKQFLSMTWHRALLWDIFIFGKHHLDDNEKKLKITQEEAYRKAINNLLIANPFSVIKFKVHSIEMKRTGVLDIYTAEERFAIVLSVKDGVMEIIEIAPKVYNLICNDFSSLVTFVGILPIDEEYKLNINKYEFTLKKGE